jgi:hypothetical protein
VAFFYSAMFTITVPHSHTRGGGDDTNHFKSAPGTQRQILQRQKQFTARSANTDVTGSGTAR